MIIKEVIDRRRENCDYAHRGYRLKVMRSMTMARERRYAEGIAINNLPSHLSGTKIVQL